MRLFPAVALLAFAIALPVSAQESELSKITGESCNPASTDHFIVDTWLDTADNEALGAKCEEGYAHFLKLFSLPDDHPLWKEKCRAFGCKTRAAWVKYIDSTKAEEKYKDLRKRLAHTRTRGSKPVGASCFEAVNDNKTSFDQGILHNVGHLMLHSVYKNEKTPVWLDEGFASYIEMQVIKEVGTYCIGLGTTVQDPKKDWKKANNWPMLLREAAQWKKDADFALMRKKKEFNDITHEERAKAYSIVTFMIEKDSAAFAKYIQGLKEGKGEDQALGDGYGGLTFEKLEKEWRQWVAKS